jgi:nucleoside-diphosphate-sugar epimerase
MIMGRQRVFLTGATGTMGFLGMQELLKDKGELDLVVLARPSDRNKRILAPFEPKGLEIVWGDLTSYEDVKKGVKDADIVLHVGAFVSPQADYHPKTAMEINYGSTARIIKAMQELGQEEKTKLVYIGTVAETGDRLPPIHWGRIGDPLKPSIYDYYAVSKVAAERCVIESGLPGWVSLRQTGIIGPAMAAIEDAIMFHNCLDNVLEYVSDRDSAILLRNLCAKERSKELGNDFWQHIFNIGGGKSCRISTYAMYEQLFGAIGIKDLSNVLEMNWFATRNFHGHYYLDSDKLQNFLHFRHDSIQYFYDAYLKSLGPVAYLSKFITLFPGGQKAVGKAIKERFLKSARTEHGTVHFIEDDMLPQIETYFGSRKEWEKILPAKDFKPYAKWDEFLNIDHGYDDTKPESTLTITDVKKAAEFRGGKCLSSNMATGDWKTKLAFRCGFGHEFKASPRLVLEGGHWCPACERESWNYSSRAKIDPFFAQVWDPIHHKGEETQAIPKSVSELDVTI